MLSDLTMCIFHGGSLGTDLGCGRADDDAGLRAIPDLLKSVRDFEKKVVSLSMFSKTKQDTFLQDKFWSPPAAQLQAALDAGYLGPQFLRIPWRGETDVP